MTELASHVHTSGNRSHIVPEVLVLDLDDTLYRTYEAFAVTAALAARERLCTQDALETARAEKENIGKTFDLDAFLLNRGVSADEVSGLYDLFSEQQDPERFLYPDGLNLIEAIRRSQAPAYILTRGTVQRQKAKLISAGLENFPHVITDELIKSKTISICRDTDGAYTIETSVGTSEPRTLRAWSGTLVEDRPAGLVGLASIQWSGILIQRPGNLRTAQIGNPPEGSIRLHSLNPITENVTDGKPIGDIVGEQSSVAL